MVKVVLVVGSFLALTVRVALNTEVEAKLTYGGGRSQHEGSDTERFQHVEQNIGEASIYTSMGLGSMVCRGAGPIKIATAESQAPRLALRRGDSQAAQ